MGTTLAPAVEALKAHAPTSRHAEMLFDVLVDLLGDQGVLSTANGRTLRKLYRRDAVHADLIVPWPIAQLSLRGRIGYVSAAIDMRTGEQVPEPERPAGKAYKLRGLGPGQIDLFDGTTRITIVYGDDGGFLEASSNDLSPTRLGEIPAAVASRRAQPAELIASCVALFDPGRHGPGRVRMPVPAPGGPEGVWISGLLAARRALYAGRVPAEARFIVADGVAGTAVGVGATLEAATAEFLAKVAASPPKPSREIQTGWDDYDDDGKLIRRGKPMRPGEPPPWEEENPWLEEGAPPEVEPEPEPGVVDMGGGTMMFTGPKSDDVLPEVTVATVPSAVIPLAASPTAPPPIGRWERTIGALGATAHVARRVGPEGFLQIGERVLWRVDPRTLEDVLDGIDSGDGRVDAMPGPENPFARFCRFLSRTYEWRQGREGVPAGLAGTGAQSGPVFEGTDLDGDREGSLVRRHVKIPRGRM